MKDLVVVVGDIIRYHRNGLAMQGHERHEVSLVVHLESLLELFLLVELVASGRKLRDHKASLASRTQTWKRLLTSIRPPLSAQGFEDPGLQSYIDDLRDLFSLSSSLEPLPSWAPPS